MTVEVEQTEELFLDPRAIARQFIAEAVVNLRIAQHQAHLEFLADEAAMRHHTLSARVMRGWATRKARLAGIAAPVDALADFD